ncbi:YopJ/AvrA family T3SS effector serine/threonine acetyltransferase [Bartonella sp. 1-1C]|uniref:YopJ/AvrA family T3SS effector serine/threonine acetyltransferase n=1 Tax=Bartonella sp. 1-1C TaxID=515256 RepID=UPI0001F4CC61|nr:YopJ/AvrA family T3SS effector serine/threonine acetyltransferase [Bartonella sp. 1-1C]ATO56933.1 YopJ -like peptidase, cysteine peptidase, MEROPS family C55 [Bartonella sp. 1-1C]CBI80366.1 Effector protein yopJ [Bartonella sp. 1-1C]
MRKLLSAIRSAVGLSNTEDGVGLSNEALANVITDLERDIADIYWPDINYIERDVKMMDALIRQANNKYPEMNLTLIKEPRDLVASIKKTIKNRIKSSRYIINVGGNDNRIHFAVLDHQTIDNKVSLILFEPARFDFPIPAILGAKMQSIMECRLPDCYFSMAEMDIQRSISECGIFSLALAKKFYLRSDKLERLHRDNIKGDRWDREVHLSSGFLDMYLPIDFYKHVQGLRRLKEYVKKNPGSENEIVNKKNETIFERFEKNTVVTRGRAMSVSAHKKRITEYKSLMR